MGADAYNHTTPYETDLNEALQKLRRKVFESGKFAGGDYGFDSIDEALMEMAESGTASILDVCALADEPGIGDAAPVSKENLINYFGSEKPTKNDLEKGQEYFNSMERGECRYMILHDHEGTPTEIYFHGYSWD